MERFLGNDGHKEEKHLLGTGSQNVLQKGRDSKLKDNFQLVCFKCLGVMHYRQGESILGRYRDFPSSHDVAIKMGPTVVSRVCGSSTGS